MNTHALGDGSESLQYGVGGLDSSEDYVPVTEWVHFFIFCKLSISFSKIILV